MFLLALAPIVHAADLPLDALAYDVDVEGPLAQIVVEQVFHNDHDVPIEATYVFPLDPSAAVDDLEITIGDRMITGELLERGAAEQVYAEARAAGHTAALTTQERANVFTQHVTNIAPGASVRVRLSVIQPVPRVHGAYELTIPLVVAPRFVPPGVDAPTPAYVAPTLAQDGAPDTGIRRDGTGVSVDLDVRLHARDPFVTLDSPTHPGFAAPMTDGYAVHVEDVPATRDFVLRWSTAESQPGVAMLVAGEHAIVTFEPPAASAYGDRVPRELIFVLDRSGSMAGVKIEVAKQAMREALAEMDPNDAFTVVTFSDAVDLWSGRPVTATPAQVASATAYIDALKVQGGTHLMAAVGQALALPADPTRHRIIAVVSDGDIANDDDVIRTVTGRTDVTVATIGIGAAPNHYVLSELAVAGGGPYEVIRLTEDPAVAVRRILGAVDRPVLTEVHVDWGAWAVEDVVPEHLPDLRVDQPALIAARLAGGDGPITVTGRLGAGWWTTQVWPLRVEAARPIATAWARRRVGQLHRDFLARRIADERTPIVALALEYEILSDYTSFVAVDHDFVVDDTGKRVAIAQPLDVPDGAEATRTSPYSAESLGQIPSGRSYHDAVAMAPGVVVAPLASRTPTDEVLCVASTRLAPFDAGPDRLRAAAVAPAANRIETAVDEAIAANNNLRGGARLAGWGAAGARGDSLAADLSGRLRRDRVWAGAEARWQQAVLGDRLTVRQTAAMRVHAQPRPEWRLEATGAIERDEALIGGVPTRLDGRTGQAAVQHFTSPHWSWSAEWTGSTRTIAGETRGRFGGRLGLLGYDVRALGLHTPDVAVGAERFVTKAGERGDVFVRLADAWRPVSVLRIAPRLHADAILDAAPRLVGHPALAVAWEPRDTVVQAQVARDIGLDAIAAGLPGAPPARTVAELQVTQRLDASGIAVAVAYTEERAPWVVDPTFAPTTALLDAPTYTRARWTADVGVEHHAHRIDLSAGYRLTPWARGGEAWLGDPDAMYVRGYLDGYRTHRLAARAAWRVPLDPWTLTLAAEGRWASALLGDGWWLGDSRLLSFTATQAIPVRKGHLEIDAGVTWAVRDLGASLVPVGLLANTPALPSLQQQAPVRGRVGVGGRFD